MMRKQNINKNFGDTVFVKVQQSELQALNYSISSFDDTMEGAKDLARELIKADAALNSVTQNRRHKFRTKGNFTINDKYLILLPLCY